MTNLYSTNSRALSDDKVKKDNKDEANKPELSPEDQLFFDAIKKALHQIEKEPSSSTIQNILKYSKKTKPNL